MGTEGNLAIWEGVFASRAWGRYPPEELVRFVARRFPVAAARSGQRILEVGCGPGANVWYLAREGFAVSGIDGAPSAIRQAGERLAAEGLSADLRVGNFERLPWDDGAFDAVVDIEALSSNRLPTIRATITEIRRVLKAGGAFFAKMFTPRTTGALTGEEVEPGTRAQMTTGPLVGLGTVHFCTQDEIRDLLADFSDVTIDLTERTDGGGAITVSEWLVKATR